ncbi:hypothetical protein TRICI_001576 [Trichomonascus ciferrii]|uniref:Zn(2)-C6 fungal-type domain-containing protein n=1 Tax=Trichomonascus ciferrii TaxID=44093 RepID=A0A642VCJ1_9ASCO|nr:hypothetical protein TRICI_001576 [Trichomonascus ciferrii]
MQKVTKKSRSAKACHACHASKVRCDITVTGPPCNRCKKRGITDCSTFPSRRGTYDRKEWLRKRQLQQQQQQQQQQQPSQQGKDSLPQQPEAAAPISSIYNTQSGARERDTLPGPQQDVPSDPIPPPAPVELPRTRPNVQSPAQYSSASSNSVGSFGQDDDSGESWECVVEYFLKKKKSKIQKSALTFLGESSPLTTLLRSLKSSGHIQINGLENGDTPNSNPGSSPTVDPETRALEEKGCFKLPNKSALETLFRYYFENVHPFNPIINRVWFSQHYKSNTLSYLLIHSVCFAASYHCPMSAIFEAEFTSRKQAKYSFYMKAKNLFDCNYEKDKLIALQSCILLSFWAGKPNDVWNPRTWLGVAFSIAEDLGMHRSTKGTDMSASDKSHLRIMWWTLCNRDIMTSLTFGRPPRVTLERCDVEKLTLDDFAAADEDPGDSMFGHREIVQSFYHMEVSKLTKMLHQVFMARCDPNAPRSSALNSSQYQQLLAWRSEIPSQIDWENNKDSIFAICLRILYHHVTLYIFRPRTSDTTSAEDCSLDKSLESASEIAMAASKLSMKSMISVPQDVYGSFFMAMVILAIDTRSHMSSNPEASSMQLQICKMVLSQSEGSWDHAQWVIKIFDRLMEQQNQLDNTDNNSAAATPTATGNNLSSMNNWVPNSSFDSQLPFHQPQPMPELDTSMKSLTDFCVPEYSDLFKIIFGGDNVT